MTRHRPFVLRGRLLLPPAIEHSPHLDAVLLATRFAVEGPETFGAPFPHLARHPDGPFRASAGIFATAGVGGMTMSRETRIRRVSLQRDSELIGVPEGAPARLRRIDEMSPFRPRLNALPVMNGVKAIYFQAVGDRDRCLEYARETMCIGASRNVGYGEVDGWDVLDTDADPEEAGLFAGDMLLRRMPAATVRRRYGDAWPRGTVLVNKRLEAPYWMDEGREPAADPTMRSLVMSEERALEILRVKD